MKQFKKDALAVKVYDTRDEMGKKAAMEVAKRILSLLQEKEEINMIFAAAPSQNEVLKYLREDTRIPWDRINAYHMDEYVGIAKDAPQAFANFLKEAIFDRVPFKSVNLLDCTAQADEECRRYAALLEKNPVDIVCMGIGENGHIAFNDPHVADFNDPVLVKKVSLDDVCRMQQVHDGCFATLDDVPKYALTLTIPAMMKAAYCFCVVPAATKAWAVAQTVNGPVGEKCPATVLRNKQNAVLFCDADSGADLDLRDRVHMAFAGFRHNHINGLYVAARNRQDTVLSGAFEAYEPAKKIALAQGVEFNYNSLEEILADEKVDVVAIGDYYGNRGSIAIRALQAGKHVIADKPLCVSREELLQIKELAAQKDLTVGIMLDMRDNVNVHTALAAVKAGLIGKVNNIVFEGQHPLLYGSRAAWYFGEEIPGAEEKVCQEKSHGGVINDIGIHGVDLVRLFTDSDVEEIIGSRCWNFYADKEPDFKDSAQFLIKMGSGAGVMADVSYAAPASQGYSHSAYWHFRIWGEKGMLEFNYYDPGVKACLDGETVPKVLDEVKPEGNYIDAFVNAIHNKAAREQYNNDMLCAAEQTIAIQDAAKK